MESFDELLGFLHDPKVMVQFKALQAVLQYIRNPQYIERLLYNNSVKKKPVFDDILSGVMNFKQKAIQDIALTVLITLTSDAKYSERICELLLQKRIVDKIMRILPMYIKVEYVKNKDKEESKIQTIQLMLMVLCNVTQFENGVRQLLKMEILTSKELEQKKALVSTTNTNVGSSQSTNDDDDENQPLKDKTLKDSQQVMHSLSNVLLNMSIDNEFYLDQLLDAMETQLEVEKILKQDQKETCSCIVKWISNIIQNVSRTIEGRALLTKEENVKSRWNQLIQWLLIEDKYCDISTRKAIVGLIKNCTFEKEQFQFIMKTVPVLEPLLILLPNKKITEPTRELITECLLLGVGSNLGIIKMKENANKIDEAIEKFNKEKGSSSRLVQMLESLKNFIVEQTSQSYSEGDVIAVDHDSHEIRVIQKGEESKKE